jgi:hypothetical protein
MSQNLNQFGPPTVIRGMLALNQPGISGLTITAIISASQATAMSPGDFVKLDTAAQPGMPSAVAAAVGDTLWGCLIWSPKKASYVAGDVVEVALPGSIIWLTAGATISAGAQVEDTGSSTIQTKSAQALRGEVIDPATSTQLTRVRLRNI